MFIRVLRRLVCSAVSGAERYPRGTGITSDSMSSASRFVTTSRERAGRELTPTNGGTPAGQRRDNHSDTVVRTYTARRDSVTHHNAKDNVSSPETGNLSESVLLESRLAV